jgi:hypothetical protein
LFFVLYFCDYIFKIGLLRDLLYISKLFPKAIATISNREGFENPYFPAILSNDPLLIIRVESL